MTTFAAWQQNYTIADGDLLLGGFSSDSGFTYSGGANTPTHEYSTEYSRTGAGTIKFQTPSGAYGEIGGTFTAQKTYTGRVGVWVYVPDWTKLSSITLYYGTAGYAAFYTRNHNFAIARHQFNGWHFLQTDASEWSVSGGSPAFGTSDFAATKIRVTPQSGEVATIYYDSTIANCQSRAKIIIVADDGYGDNWYSTGLPILDAAGLKCTMGIIADKIDTTSLYMTLAQLRTAVGNGHELCTHGPIGGSGSLTAYSTQAEIETDIAYHRDWIVNNGLGNGVGELFYIYPQGRYELSSGNNTIRNALIALGMLAARRASNGDASSSIPYPLFDGGSDPYSMQIIGHAFDSAGTEAANIANILTRIDNVVKWGRLGVLMFHKVVSGTPGESIEIEDTNFQTIVTRLAQLRSFGLVDVVTFRDYWLGRTQPQAVA